MQPLKCYPPDTSILYVAFKNYSKGLIMDFKTKRVFRDGKEIKLTAKEFKLLSLLYSDRGKVFSKEEILLEIWGIDFDPGSNSIEVYFSFLRTKVDKPFDKKLICTKAGFGYYLGF